MTYIGVFALAVLGCLAFFTAFLLLNGAVTALVSRVRCPNCNGRPAWLSSHLGFDGSFSSYLCLRCGRVFRLPA